MKTILMLFLSLTVSGCEIVGAVGIISNAVDISSAIKFDQPISDYEVAFNEAIEICLQKGQKAKFRTAPPRTIIRHTTADFDCVSLSNSGSVSSLSAPPIHK